MGPVGYGIVFQFINFLNIFTSTIHLGVPTGITAKLSSLTSDSNAENKKLIDFYFIYFARGFFIITTFFTILFIIFSKDIVNFLVGEIKEINLFILIICCAPFIVLYSIFEAFLRCYTKLTIIVLISIISSASSIILLYPLLIEFNYLGIGLYFFINSLFVIILYIIFDFNNFKLLFKKKVKEKLLHKNQIFKIGVVSLISSFLFIGSSILLRKFAIENFGLNENGIYQSVSTLSASCFLLVYNYLTTYLLPRISKSKTNLEIIDELDKNLRFVLLLMIPIMLVVFSYRLILINLLFSREFEFASTMLHYQFLGDFFRGLSGLFGIWMIFKLKLKVIFIFDIIMNLILIGIPFISLLIFENVGLSIIPISYMIALALHFLLYFIYTQAVLKYSFSLKTLKTISVSVVSIIAVYLCDIYFISGLYFLTPLIIVAFWYIAISNDEKIQFIGIIKKSFKLN